MAEHSSVVSHRADPLIVASDGLSDPWPDLRGNGLRMEAFIEVKGMQDLTFDEIKGHWIFAAIESFSQNAAASGQFVDLVEEMGVLSIELPTDVGPDGWLKPNGRFGALMNVPVEGRALTVDMPLEPIRLIPITMLYPNEIDVCAEGGEARRAMAADLQSHASGHITDISRPPLR